MPGRVVIPGKPMAGQVQIRILQKAQLLKKLGGSKSDRLLAPISDRVAACMMKKIFSSASYRPFLKAPGCLSLLRFRSRGRAERKTACAIPALFSRVQPPGEICGLDSHGCYLGSYLLKFCCVDSKSVTAEIVPAEAENGRHRISPSQGCRADKNRRGLDWRQRRLIPRERGWPSSTHRESGNLTHR